MSKKYLIDSQIFIHVLKKILLEDKFLFHDIEKY